MTLPSHERDFVGVRGPDAASYLQAMVSNDVEALALGESCDALLLTPKGRVIAPMIVFRRAVDDFLLLSQAGLGEPIRSTLVRSRFAAKCDIELEEHRSTLVVGLEGPAGTVANRDYGVPAHEIIDGEAPDLRYAEPEYLARLQIHAKTPRFGSEIDDRVLPAEAGLIERFVSFEKGCFPGQEPIARQHYRGRVNRELRVLLVKNPGGSLPPPDGELVYDGKAVGRLTSVVREDDGNDVLALGYVRTEVPGDAVLAWDGHVVTQLDLPSARP